MYGIPSKASDGPFHFIVQCKPNFGLYGTAQLLVESQIGYQPIIIMYLQPVVPVGRFAAEEKQNIHNC